MAKKRTTAERRAAALASWKRRKAGLPPTTPVKKKRKGKARTQPARSELLPNPEGYPAQIILQERGYDTLAFELKAAFDQSASGKGKQRHANGRSFDRQPIMEIGRMVGPGYAAGQAQKKAQEALGMLGRGEKAKAIAELHGAIVYLSAAAALIREQG